MSRRIQGVTLSRSQKKKRDKKLLERRKDRQYKGFGVPKGHTRQSSKSTRYI